MGDFAKQTLGGRLKEAGFDEDVPAVFVMEGVTQYIPKSGLEDTLRYVGSLKSATFTFTYVHQFAWDNPAALDDEVDVPKLMEKMKNQKEPWISGYYPKDFPSLLASHGLKLTS